MNSPHVPLRSSLQMTAALAADYIESLGSRRCGVAAFPSGCLSTLDRSLPQTGVDADDLIRDLVRDLDPGLVASGSPRHFGFVMSACNRGALMADWLTSAWNQNAQVYVSSPSAAMVEELVACWLLELLDLPKEASVGFVTGAQMANFTALVCARNAVLERAGWDLEHQGLFGAPEPLVLFSECVHATVRSALKMAGFGLGQLRELPSDQQGCLRLEALQSAIQAAGNRPLILSLQAGNVNTGGFEAVAAIADMVRGRNAWIHVDGAFGLWAAVSPKTRYLLHGFQQADSWSTDAHKWLNVPLDSGIVVIKDSAQHRKLKGSRCSYAGEEAADKRDGSVWAPENSRRARAFVLYTVIRELGAEGIRHLVERCCLLARRFAEGAGKIPGVIVENGVVLNQVLLRWEVPPPVDADYFHNTLASALQDDGRCWLGASHWRGRTLLRFSLCNMYTTEDDIKVTLAALAELGEKTLSQLSRQTGEARDGIKAATK